VQYAFGCKLVGFHYTPFYGVMLISEVENVL